MRELGIDDLERVSGGDGAEAIGIWGLAITIAGVTGIATAGVATAFLAAPVAAATVLGLSFAGGVRYLQPSKARLGTVTVGGDYRQSDC